MQSKLGQGRVDTDLTDHLFKIRYSVWISLAICILILSLMSFIDKIAFKTIRQMNAWILTRLLLTQCIKD